MSPLPIEPAGYIGWACQHGNHRGCDSRRHAKRWCRCECHASSDRPDPAAPVAGSGPESAASPMFTGGGSGSLAIPPPG